MNVLTPTANAKTATAIAQRLSVAPTKVYELIGNGSLVAIDVSARADQRPRWRITEADFQSFLSQRSSITSPITEV